MATSQHMEVRILTAGRQVEIRFASQVQTVPAPGMERNEAVLRVPEGRRL
ncbi:DEKNAAC101528 [Brettanomyces naardenensis]|uniref:DEKNAAC101528 n=1 Tax=Brettanomyces naardenensis TaxID=13370 RepID=A0A448YIA3_BRENA|nr:DEKNAAC101528 [Brettanomyces naardenensis]